MTAVVERTEPVPKSTRKLRRAERRAERARRRADRLRAQLGERQPKPGPGPRRRRRRVAVLAVVAAGGAAGTYAATSGVGAGDQPPTTASVAVETVDGLGRAIVVRQGTVGIGDLAARQELLAIDAIAADDDGVDVLMPLVVTDGGRLEVRGTQIRLRSDAEASVPIQVDGGSLHVFRAEIVAWDGEGPDTDPSDGRAWISVAGSQLEVRASTIRSLGSAEPGRLGLEVGSGSTGRLEDLQIQDPYVGLHLSGALAELAVDDVDVFGAHLAGFELASASGVTIRSSLAADGVKDGFVLSGRTAEVSVTGSDAAGNGASGFAVDGAAGSVELAGNRSFRNRGPGISIANTRGVTARGNRVWANSGGIALAGANAASEVTDNEISGNRGSGIDVGSPGTTVAIAGNVVDHNEVGVTITNGSVELRSNTITANGTGVAVLDSSPAATVVDNTIDGNYDAGIRLVSDHGLEVTGNSLLGNTNAAFVVDIAGSAQGYLPANRAEGGRYGVERVQPPERSASDLADVTPIPTYFFLPADRALDASEAER